MRCLFLLSAFSFDKTIFSTPLRAQIDLGDEKDDVGLVLGDGRVLEKIPVEKITMGRPMGSGAFGSVRAASLGERAIAVKTINPSDVPYWERELQSLSQLNHPNIVKLLGYCDTPAGRDGLPRQIHILMDLLVGNSFKHRFLEWRQQGLSFEKRLVFACELASGVAHMHAQKVLHRDLETSNLLATDMDGNKAHLFIGGTSLLNIIKSIK